MIDTERVLYGGRLGAQHVRIWLDRHGGGVRLLSHDIGSGLESSFGKAEIETFLEVEERHVPNLVAALRAERGSDAPMDVIQLLVDRYRGDASATTAFRVWLTSRGIPYRFTIV